MKTVSDAHGRSALNDALERIHLLPGTKTYLIEVGPVRGGRTWRVAHLPDQRVFIGSAFKTFTFAKFMQDVEAGRLSLNAPITIADRVRMTADRTCTRAKRARSDDRLQ